MLSDRTLRDRNSWSAGACDLGLSLERETDSGNKYVMGPLQSVTEGSKCVPSGIGVRG